MDGVEAADGPGGSVLVIGFGRFGQIASPGAAGPRRRREHHRHRHRHDPRRRRFRFKVYYGDGTAWTCCRPRAPARRAPSSCASTSRTTRKIVEVAREEFPRPGPRARLRPRPALELITAGVDFEVRETWSPRSRSGKRRSARSTSRRRGRGDRRRGPPSGCRTPEPAVQPTSGDFKAGRDLLRGNVVRPAPLTPAANERQPLGEAGRLTPRRPEPQTIGRPPRTTVAGCAGRVCPGRRGRDCRGSWTYLGAGPERGVDLRAVESAHRTAVQAERACREDEVAPCRLEFETQWCRRLHLGTRSGRRRGEIATAACRGRPGPCR